MRFFYLSVFCCLMLANAPLLRVAAQEQPVSYAQELAKGQHAHETGLYDSAFQY